MSRVDHLLQSVISPNKRRSVSPMSPAQSYKKYPKYSPTVSKVSPRPIFMVDTKFSPKNDITFSPRPIQTKRK